MLNQADDETTANVPVVLVRWGIAPAVPQLLYRPRSLLGHAVTEIRVRTVCSTVALAVLCGLTAGVAAAIFLLGLIERLLFGVKPLDARSFAMAAGLVIVCAATAAAVPACRAVRIGPSSAVRQE